MDLKKKLSNSVPAQVFVSLCFFLSGLIANFFQFVLFHTLAFIDIHLYRRINYYLTYTIWAQIVALADFWAGTQLTIYYADEKSRQVMGTRHTMYIMNHNYEIDWLMAWLATDRYNILGNAKSFAKKSLRFIPIIGWSWIFGEFAFLERNWEKDSHKISTALNKFLDYKSPISFLFFAEGTRFTKEKHENSVKFAKERGLPVLTHHLLPRTKGFSFSVKTFKEKYPEMLVCQIELRFPKDSPPPTFMSLVKARPLKPDLYVRFVSVGDIPSDTEEEMNNYLYDLYKEKDELVEYYEKNNEFPGIKVVVPPRRATLYNWLAWLLFGCIVIPYYLASIFLYGSWLTIGIISSIILFGMFSIYMMVSSTKIQKTGSKYGTGSAKKSE